MKVIGVDAGVKGAVCHLDTDDGSTFIYDLPIKDDHSLDCAELFDKWTNVEADSIIVEDVFRPNCLLRMVGGIEACAEILGLSIKRIAVVTWKKKVLGYNTSDKTVSIAKCKSLYPTASLIKPRARTASPDRAEAVLLAEYGASLLPNYSGNLRLSVCP